MPLQRMQLPHCRCRGLGRCRSRDFPARLLARPAPSRALRRKLASAKRLRPRLRRAADAPVEYSSAEGFGEEAEAAQRDGIAADFDARLAAAAEAAPDESPGGP